MVRIATKNDLPKIVRVHKICFPKSFTTAMGTKLLTKYYEEFMDSNPELFLVSVANTEFFEIDGFCMGYYGENSNCTLNFIKKNCMSFVFRILWLLLIFNGTAWKKVFNMLKNKYKTVTVDESFGVFKHTDSGELLSICVLPEKQGGGAAAMLVDEYLKVLVNNGRHRCLLSVFADNKRAIHFYEKKGFSVFKKIGNISLIYAKII